MLLPPARFSAPPAGAPASQRAAPVRILGGVALTWATVVPLVDGSTTGGWLVAAALAAGAVAVLPADRPGHRDARTPRLVPTAPEAALSEHELDERLRALHDAHVEEVDMALAEGREDVVRSSSDRYIDAALKLLTSAQHPAT